MDCLVCTVGAGVLANMEKNYYHHKKHREWRAKVLRKDKYLCQECLRYGKKTLATIAHHIKPADEYPELRYDVSNGKSLCAACHNKKHPEKGGRWR